MLPHSAQTDFIAKAEGLITVVCGNQDDKTTATKEKIETMLQSITEILIHSHSCVSHLMWKGLQINK